jgi:hypothetical protein
MSSNVESSECVSKLEYGGVMTNKNNGGKSVPVTLEGEWITIQIGSDKTPQTINWPLSQPMQGQDPDKRTMEVVIRDPSLVSLLESLDEKNKEMASLHSESWFRKKRSPGEVENMYMPILKTKEEDGTKSIKVKVKIGENYKTEILRVNSENEYSPGTKEDIARGAKCAAIIDTQGIWINQMNCGMSFACSTLLVWTDQRKKARGVAAFKLSNPPKADEGKEDEE